MLNKFIKDKCKNCPAKNCKTTQDVIECFLAYLQFRKDYIDEEGIEPTI